MRKPWGKTAAFLAGLLGLIPIAACFDQAMLTARETASVIIDALIIQRTWLLTSLGFVALLTLLAWTFPRGILPRPIALLIAVLGGLVVIAPFPILSGLLSPGSMSRTPNVLECIIYWTTIPRTFTGMAGAFLMVIGLAAAVWPHSNPSTAEAAARSDR